MVHIQNIHKCVLLETLSDVVWLYCPKCQSKEPYKHL